MPLTSPAVVIERLSKGKPVPAVLLHGSDAYIRETCRARIVDVSIEPAARGWGVSRFSAAEDELLSGLTQARTLPMLAPRQVVIISEMEALEQLDDKERDQALADVTAYISDPAPFTVLVLEATALDQRTKLAKMLAEKVLVLEAELPSHPAERLQMAAVLASEMARERASAIDADAAEEVADLCNCDMSMVRSEIEKLATYAGEGQTIRLADVELLVSSEKKHTVWELAELLASGRRASAFAFLDNLLREGEQPPALVGAMAWMFRTLLQIQDFGPNVPRWQITARLRIRDATVDKAMQQARRIPRRQILAGLRALYDADNQLKSGAKNDRAIMEFLLGRLTNIKSSNARPHAAL